MIALFTVVAAISMSVSAFGVFLPVLNATFGWTRGAISVALSINLALGGAAAFAVASVADRRGPRGVLALTVLIGAAGLLLTSRISALWQFYLSYGVMVGIGFSSVYVLTTATVSRWFVERRGLALAVVLSGFNLGWLIGGPVAAMLISLLGWRAAYVVLGLVVCGIGVPACTRVRYPQPLDVTRGEAFAGRGETSAAVRASLRSALRDPRLWLLTFGWFSTGLVFMMITAHCVPFARDRGLPLEQASLLLTAYGIGSATGRLGSGLVADRFGATVTMYACVAIQALALGFLVGAPPAWALMPVLVVFGLGASGADNAVVKIVPEVFGLAALASVMSVLSLGWRFGAALGPAGAGFLYDLTRSYTVPFSAGLGILAVSVVLFTLATRRT
ncbi:MAG TPA: MFS transporter [Candidatus Acidoferrum sp.]|nr:MFS transporter [Candidatus Acidoferrum sp.]